jgi:hypothetical protein
MAQPAKSCSQRGLLLVEAVISAVIIAVGLVSITRGLSSQLKALQSVGDYAVMTRLAHGMLTEVERSVQAGQPPQRARAGTFEPPDAVYEWSLEARVPEDQTTAVPVTVVTLSVRRADRSSGAVSVRAVWPSEWVPVEWL